MIKIVLLAVTETSSSGISLPNRKLQAIAL